ncbi:hypothetical protein OESDEN_07442 [Oesophagostomum dentatum]|uniref:Secreted protein n=1 Tax=Oesophagostomum dentatum TaxID=61180 RepID=A0A0B1T554_OESDE|nr:hypothetical protein OESDEN_07442 [Oesophagostomum dentatum]
MVFIRIVSIVAGLATTGELVDHATVRDVEWETCNCRISYEAGLIAHSVEGWIPRLDGSCPCYIWTGLRRIRPHNSGSFGKLSISVVFMTSSLSDDVLNA